MSISKIFLFLTIVSVGLVNSSDICSPSDLREYKNISIIGIIKNFKSVSQYIDSKTFLQLVSLPSSFEILGQTNVKGMEGRTQFISDKPKATIKRDGSFEIKCNKIAAGNYFIQSSYQMIFFLYLELLGLI